MFLIVIDIIDSLSSMGQSTVCIFLVVFVSTNAESLSADVTVGEAYDTIPSNISGLLMISEIQ